MAHLGILKALENNGVVVDMIAGTSAGAMTGTLYAAGLDVDYVTERFVEDLKPAWPFRMMPRGNHWYLLYKYRRGHFDRMLRQYLSDWTLEQLPLPIQSVTVDLVTGQPVVRDRSDALIPFWRASTCQSFQNRFAVTDRRWLMADWLTMFRPMCSSGAAVIL